MELTGVDVLCWLEDKAAKTDGCSVMKGLPWIPKTWQLSSGPWRVLDVFELKK